MNYKKHTHCRVCQSERMTPYLDLGNLPLSNNLCKTADEEAETYPLEVLFCNDCGLSQLSIVVDPEILFGNYVYRSSISKGYRDHCYAMAQSLKEQYGLDESSFHIDIAGNDSALLVEFRKVINGRMLNVDPARNMVEINDKQGIRQYATFWGIEAANHLKNTGWPKADLITATNVFAHENDIRGFLQAAKDTLSETGVIVMEFPYLINFIEGNEFSTVYFEHLSYVMISPLKQLCESIGLTVMDVEEFEIHCGSVRVHIGMGKQEKSVQKFLDREEPYMSIEPYRVFARQARLVIDDFADNIWDLNRKGFKVAAFAASAKGNTLMNAAEVGSKDIMYIIDETPEKMGMYSPGTHIPIVPLEKLLLDPPDYLVVLAWNFLNEIRVKCKDIGYKGKFITPIPIWTEID